MRLLLAVSLCTAVFLLPQDTIPTPAQAGNQSAAEKKDSTEKLSITIPAGSKVILAMTSPVWSKTVRPGDPIYSTTAIPMAAGNQMAIPPGTYAQGIIDAVTKPTRWNDTADFQIHFTALIFANGYTVALPGNPAVATATVHVRVSYRSDILLDNGSQIEMTLQSAVTLDSEHVAEAAQRSKAPPIWPNQSATRCRPIPGTPGTSDTVIPGTPGTPGTPPTVIPGGPGMPDTVLPGSPGTPGTPDTVIPGSPGTPDTVIPGSPGTPGYSCPGPPIVISGPALPLYNHEGLVTFAKPVQVGGKKLKKGAYQVYWAGSGPMVPAEIKQKGKTIVSVMARVAVLPEKSLQDEPATRTNPNGTDSLSSLKFAGQTFQLLFD